MVKAPGANPEKPGRACDGAILSTREPRQPGRAGSFVRLPGASCPAMTRTTLRNRGWTEPGSLSRLPGRQGGRRAQAEPRQAGPVGRALPWHAAVSRADQDADPGSRPADADPRAVRRPSCCAPTLRRVMRVRLDRREPPWQRNGCQRSFPPRGPSPKLPTEGLFVHLYVLADDHRAIPRHSAAPDLLLSACRPDRRPYRKPTAPQGIVAPSSTRRHGGGGLASDRGSDP